MQFTFSTTVSFQRIVISNALVTEAEELEMFNLLGTNVSQKRIFQSYLQNK